MEVEPDEIIGELSDLDKVILLLFHSNDNEPIRDELFYQKEIFLASNYINEIKNDADFIPSLLGPYSESAEVHLKNLISYSLIDRSKEEYVLSEKGKKIAEMLNRHLGRDYANAIADFKDLLNDISMDELLVFIYFSFPNFTKESLMLERVKKNRIPASISLYHKGKVSLAKAASLAGLCIEDFLDLLREN